jgi:glycosyltransferase involved in cell wall biosynthesis
MHIGVDATCWQNTRGYGRHGRALLRALLQLDANNRYTFFLDSPDDSEPLPPAAEVVRVRSAAPTAVAAAADSHRSIRDMWRMSRAMSNPGIDLLLFPTVYSYVPAFSRAKKVVIIHDIIPEMYPQLTLPSRTAQLFWRAKAALGRWQADSIVTVSDYSRQCIIEQFGIAPERVSVVGEASDPIFRVLDGPQPTERLSSLGVTAANRVVVYLGGFGPHKNLDALVAVFAKLVCQEAFSDLRLLMVGKYDKDAFHSHFGPIKRQIEELDLADRVLFTGYLPDDDLVILLNLATVLVLPSLMEGFGLPAIEAAACGCPVVATAASPLPTLLGDGGLYVDPLEHRELELALGRVLGSPELRREMRTAGILAARELTWDAAARQLKRLIEEVLTQ